MVATLLNAPSGTTFGTMAATRLSSDPPVPSGSQYDYDVPNDGTTVLTIDRTSAGGSFSFQVLMNPQWPGMAASAFVTPKNVAIDSWSLTSHN